VRERWCYRRDTAQRPKQGLPRSCQLRLLRCRWWYCSQGRPNMPHLAGGFQFVRCLRRPHGWRLLKDLRRSMPRVGHHEHSRRSHRQHVRHDTLRAVHGLFQVLRAQRMLALQAGLFLPHVHTNELVCGVGRHRLHHLEIPRTVLRLALIEIRVPGGNRLLLVPPPRGL